MTENQVNVPANSCYQVKCDKCGKTTWKGCGMHVDSATRRESDVDVKLSPPHMASCQEEEDDIPAPQVIDNPVMASVKEEDKCSCPRA